MEISPGKGHILRPITAASTPLDLLITGVAMMCLLTHPREPLYAVPVRQYGPLQFGTMLYQLRQHTLPSVQGSLPTTLRLANPYKQLRGKGLAPSGYSKNNATLR